MRIDPSQLSEPLAHILGAGATDAAGGQKASAAASERKEVQQLDSLDEMLLRRLRANATADAANSVVSYQDAQVRMTKLQQLAQHDPITARDAQGALDSARVRGLLGD